MSTQPKTRITPEQYLEIDRKAEYKSEYFDGEMFPMDGARRPGDRADSIFAHDRLVANAIALVGRPEVVDESRNTLLNPTLMVEVTMPSTEAYARGLKFEHYRSVDSLNEYLLIASDRMHVDLFTREADGRWLLTSVSSLDTVVELKSIGCRLSLADLYAQVDFA